MGFDYLTSGFLYWRQFRFGDHVHFVSSFGSGQIHFISVFCLGTDKVGSFGVVADKFTSFRYFVWERTSSLLFVVSFGRGQVQFFFVTSFGIGKVRFFSLLRLRADKFTSFRCFVWVWTSSLHFVTSFGHREVYFLSLFRLGSDKFTYFRWFVRSSLFHTVTCRHDVLGWISHINPQIILCIPPSVY